MSTFTLTHRAKTDLKSIARFTENSWGREQRVNYIKQFDNTFQMLADTPEIGKNCSYIKPNYQKFPQGSHVIFYQITTQITTQNCINIIRILHKNMDVQSKFADS